MFCIRALFLDPNGKAVEHSAADGLGRENRVAVELCGVAVRLASLEDPAVVGHGLDDALRMSDEASRPARMPRRNLGHLAGLEVGFIAKRGIAPLSVELRKTEQVRVQLVLRAAPVVDVIQQVLDDVIGEISQETPLLVV